MVIAWYSMVITQASVKQARFSAASFISAASSHLQITFAPTSLTLAKCFIAFRLLSKVCFFGCVFRESPAVMITNVQGCPGAAASLVLLGCDEVIT